MKKKKKNRTSLPLKTSLHTNIQTLVVRISLWLIETASMRAMCDVCVYVKGLAGKGHLKSKKVHGSILRSRTLFRVVVNIKILNFSILSLENALILRANDRFHFQVQ